jgi:hypothetical protein
MKNTHKGYLRHVLYTVLICAPPMLYAGVDVALDNTKAQKGAAPITAIGQPSPTNPRLLNGQQLDDVKETQILPSSNTRIIQTAQLPPLPPLPIDLCQLLPALCR